MKKANSILTSIIVFMILSVFSSQIIHAQNLSNDDKSAIISVLHQQESMWNEGNITGYMEGYLHSDSLKFITKKGVTYGWENTLQKYQKSYPDKAAMGNLRFDVLNVEALCDNKAIMTGKWTLTISGQNKDITEIIGYFTLIWQKIDGKWLIIIDHTS
jgi:hypothetical protein